MTPIGRSSFDVSGVANAVQAQRNKKGVKLHLQARAIAKCFLWLGLEALDQSTSFHEIQKMRPLIRNSAIWTFVIITIA